MGFHAKVRGLQPPLPILSERRILIVNSSHMAPARGVQLIVRVPLPTGVHGGYIVVLKTVSQFFWRGHQVEDLLRLRTGMNVVCHV